MAAGIRIPFISDVTNFLRGTKDIEKSLENVEDSLDDVAKEGEKATEKLEQSFENLSESAEASFKDIRTSSKRAMDDVDSDLKGTSLKDTGSEIGAEFSENIGEGLRSGDYVGTLEETFTSLAGALGPAGIGIGVGAALAFNFIKGLDDQSEAFNAAVSSFLGAIDEQTKRIDFSKTFTDQVTKMGEALTDSTDPALQAAAGIEQLRQIATDTGVPLQTLADLLSGKLDPALTGADEALADYVATNTEFVQGAHTQGEVLTESATAVDKFVQQVNPLAGALDKATESARIQSNLLGNLATNADDAAQAYARLKTSAESALAAGTASRQQVAAELNQERRP